MEYLNTNGLAHEINTSAYLKFLEPLSINESSLLAVYEYKLFLDAYLTYFSGKRTELRNVSSADIALAKMQTVNAEIKNQEVKDYLLFTVLKDHVKYYGYKNTDVLFKVFEFQCKNEQMKDGILKPYNEYLKLSKKPKAPKIRMMDKEGNLFTLDSFKGQYVYIDVWASWCLPCRKEAPFFEELKEIYQNKNIAFVGISIDAKKEDWMAFLELKESYDNQFLVKDIQAFLDAFMIKTIPHFLIIDDKGNLMDNNASRPSEGKTEWLKALPNKGEV
jgi:thiol-disulfide isomerase/thioredoxin